MLKKITAAVLLFIITLGGAAGFTVYGSNFPDDVPPGHWAFNSIHKVTDLGLMTGSTITTFGIDNMIDKFEMTRILAALTGYTRINPTFEEFTFYQSLHDKHIDSIMSYAQHLANWRHEYNMEIAFLLEKGVLTPLDLRDFMAIREGREAVFALPRFAFAIYMSRVLGVEDVARSFIPTSLFNDDHMITEVSKPFVYYMRHIGLFQGDGNNNFNPHNPVTKAMMAVMLDLAMGIMGFGTNQQGSQQGSQTPASGNITTMIGEISHVHTAFRAIEVRNHYTNERVILPVLANASIIVNGDPGFFDLLEREMHMIAILLNGEVKDLIAISQAPPSGSHSGAHFSTPNSLLDADSLTGAVIDGVVAGYSIVGESRFIDVNVAIRNAMGEIVDETRRFILAANCGITRGTNAIDFLHINQGDLARLTITGTTVHNIHLEERHRNIFGTIAAKRAVEATGMGVFTVHDANGRAHELVTAPTTIISRRGVTNIPTWRDVRIGDTVEISAEYNQILSLTAQGNREFRDIIITKIMISTAVTEITGVFNGRENTYTVIPGMGIDPYRLRIGSRVRIALDSMEIENILPLEDAQTLEVTGYIRHIGTNNLHIQNAVDLSQTLSYDFADNLIVTDINGVQRNVSALQRNMHAYVRFVRDHNGRNFITDITILGN
jgi:hypothetical protein